MGFVLCGESKSTDSPLKVCAQNEPKNEIQNIKLKALKTLKAVAEVVFKSKGLVLTLISSNYCH